VRLYFDSFSRSRNRPVNPERICQHISDFPCHNVSRVAYFYGDSQILARAGTGGYEYIRFEPYVQSGAVTLLNNAADYRGRFAAQCEVERHIKFFSGLGNRNRRKPVD
jgi:hypothetical protein